MKITPSDIALYGICPKKWQMKKQKAQGERRQIIASALFSSALHFAAKKMVMELEDPIHAFDEKWSPYENPEFPIVYLENDLNWANLSDIGHKILRKFEIEFPQKGIEVVLAENRMPVNIDGDTLVLQPDLIGEMEDMYVVGDYKTSEYPLDPLRSDVVDQLSAGALLAFSEFNVTKVKTLMCNFVKSTESIIWHFSERTEANIDAFTEKVRDMLTAMAYPVQKECGATVNDAPCKYCEYREVCHTEKNELEESLVALGMEG